MMNYLIQNLQHLQAIQSCVKLIMYVVLIRYATSLLNMWLKITAQTCTENLQNVGWLQNILANFHNLVN